MDGGITWTHLHGREAVPSPLPSGTACGGDTGLPFPRAGPGTSWGGHRRVPRRVLARPGRCLYTGPASRSWGRVCTTLKGRATFLA